MAASITIEEIDFIAERAKVTLTPAEKTELIEAYPYVAAMIELVHQPRGLGAEPAHIFIPGEGVAP